MLENLISNSFRVHENHDPVYVDVSGHLNRLASKQHQIIFGRRGSGKSCLLVHYHRKWAPNNGVLTVYLNADEIKLLRFPDIIIRTLISLLQALPGGRRSGWRRFVGRGSELEREVSALRELLDQADHSDVTQAVEKGTSAGVESGVELGPAKIGGTAAGSSAVHTTSTFSQEKVDHLERHLQDYKRLVREALSGSRYEHAAFLVDDFYLIRRSDQPDLVDYLHRLLRGTDCFLKIGTIRHRTVLMRNDDGQTVGVELTQDVESVNLDRTLEDVPAAQDYLCGILNELGRQAGIEDTVGTYLNRTAPLDLTLASGGVPRDFLTIFVQALNDARDRGAERWITPTNVYRGASRVSYRSKITNLRSDVGPESVNELEVLFQDIWNFCLKEKGKTAFLVSQTEAGQFPHEHDLLQELMDLKLVHVVEPDTSAASGREGRYEAYTLDAQSFMEPRRRNIEVVEFWKTDDQRRPVGIRESPTYPLSRARDVLKGTPEAHLDALMNEDLGEG